MSRRLLILLVLLGIVFALSIVTYSLRLSTPDTSPRMVDIVIADQIIGLVGVLLVVVIVIVWVMDRNRAREHKALQSVEAFHAFVASEDNRFLPIGTGKGFDISEDAGAVRSEMEKLILADAEIPLDPPPTPEEVHEAEMNPWPGHTMRETILRNRGQMQAPSGAPPQQQPPQVPNSLPPPPQTPYSPQPQAPLQIPGYLPQPSSPESPTPLLQETQDTYSTSKPPPEESRDENPGT